jgi:hypothetical protein
MTVTQESSAVAVARAHVEAWSNHDFDTARRSLADDVKVTVTSTNPALPVTDTTGVEDYMSGLVQFAQGVIPGSANVIATYGDERNALVMLTVKAAFPPDGAEVTLPASRLYLLDDDDKIKVEQVVFYLVSE